MLNNFLKMLGIVVFSRLHSDRGKYMLGMKNYSSRMNPDLTGELRKIYYMKL